MTQLVLHIVCVANNTSNACCSDLALCQLLVENDAGRYASPDWCQLNAVHIDTTAVMQLNRLCMWSHPQT